MKRFKKFIFNKITIALTLMLSLISICFISTRTYAYTIDVNGNLIGDNLFNYNNVINGDYQGVYKVVSFTASEGSISITDRGNYDFNRVTYSFTATINNTYTFNANVDRKTRIVVTDVTNDLIDDTNYNGGAKTFTASSTTMYIYFYAFTGVPVTYSNIMLNEGSTPKDWEPYGYWYSQNNYDDLMARYNSLNTNINIFEGNILSQKLFINNIEQNYSDYDTLFKPLQRSLYINQDNEFRFLYQDFGENTRIRYELVLTKEVSAPRVTGKIDLIDYVNINMYDVYENNIMELYYNSMSGPLGDGVFEYLVQKNIKKIIIEIEIDDTDEGRTSSVINFGNSYADGYLTGINESNSYWEFKYGVLDYNYNELFNSNDALNNKYNQLLSSFNQLSTNYSNLQDSYNSFVSGNNFTNLFFTIAETPFTTFKTIWNVDFLGVNLAGFVTGILFVGLLIWVVKKIF